MPAVSEQQREYLNSKFGHAWVKEHHFDNKGKLPQYVNRNKGLRNYAKKKGLGNGNS